MILSQFSHYSEEEKNGHNFVYTMTVSIVTRLIDKQLYETACIGSSVHRHSGYLLELKGKQKRLS